MDVTRTGCDQCLVHRDGRRSLLVEQPPLADRILQIREEGALRLDRCERLPHPIPHVARVGHEHIGSGGGFGHAARVARGRAFGCRPHAAAHSTGVLTLTATLGSRAAHTRTFDGLLGLGLVDER